MLWVEKYRPKKLEDVIADKNIIQRVKAWAKSWEKGPQKPLLLAGPPGVGKTSIALALAGSMGWEAVELNASDQRNWEIIQRIVGEGAFNETISDEGDFLSTRSGRRKVIILDEVDNIHRKEDAGGEGALIRLIKRKPRQPIILIANDPYKLSYELRNLCEMINFRRLRKNQIVAVLQRICKMEGIKADKKALEAIAENSGGDLRAAINDLQAVAEGRKELRVEDVVVAKRTQETDIFKVLQKIFKTNFSGVHGEVMLLDESPEDVIHWVEENMPLEYEGDDLLRGYEAICRADIFLGRVKRRQFYRLWKYATYLMTVGVQQAKRERKKGFTRYRRPERWQMFVRARSKRELLKRVLSKIGRYSHLSASKANLEMYPYIRLLLKNLDVEKASKIAAFYEFSEEELEFLVGERAKEIAETIERLGLHRVEDESFLSGFEGVGAEKNEEERVEIEEADELESKELRGERKRSRKDKKFKNATLDAFF